MANDISNTIRAQQLPANASNGLQSGRPKIVDVSGSGGKVSPPTGNALPVESGNQSANVVKLHEAVGNINTFVQSIQRDLSFIVDESSGKSVIRVIDSDSGKLVRQIPVERVLAIASHLGEIIQAMSADDRQVPQGMLFSDSI